MNLSRRPQVLAAWLLLAAAPAARAQEFSFGVSGLPYPLSPAPNVRLAEHGVRVELPSRRASTRTLLRNEGAATTITLAFPEGGETDEEGTLPPHGFLRDLRCTVDGQSVALKRFVPPHGLASGSPLNYEGEYHVAWTLRLRLGPRQSREVRAQWGGGSVSIFGGAPERGSLHAFRYNLRSPEALRWKGRPGLLSVVLEAGGLSQFDQVKIDLPGSRREGSRALWQARNADWPSVPETIGASWWPGLSHFRINGREPFEKCLVVGQARVLGEFQSVYPQRRGRSIWIPLRLLQSWAEQAEAKGRMAGVPGHSRVESGVTMIELEPAVRARGGSVRESKGVIEIRFGAG